MTTPTSNEELCRLYLITPPRFELTPFRDRLARALDAGDVAAVQLRLKDADEDTIKRAVELLCPVAQSRGVAFLLNDRPDLARATGCDGAHVGQDDLRAAQARKLLGPKHTLGVTCHGSRDLAMQAGEDGADYVAFGAFYPSSTKDAKLGAEPEIIRWWAELMELPCVAIGGITAENCGPLVQAGANFIAVSQAVFGYEAGEAAGVQALTKAIEAATG